MLKLLKPLKHIQKHMHSTALAQLPLRKAALQLRFRRLERAAVQPGSDKTQIGSTYYKLYDKL